MATFCKLKNGSWGVKVTTGAEVAEAGRSVYVKKRDGSTKEVALVEKLTSGPQYSIWTIQDDSPKPPRAARTSLAEIRTSGVSRGFHGEWSCLRQMT